ncbi:MAG: hypothetical protein D6704_10320 [Nitrospirae bacterium]|nr:MAG: hypothetical protein D6704_10320 [Nitrospirota bacterium]
MPVNALRKDIPKGQKPSGHPSLKQETSTPQPVEKDQLEEIELAAKEQQSLWESEEIGIVRWSGESDNRFSDPGA